MELYLLLHEMVELSLAQKLNQDGRKKNEINVGEGLLLGQ